jgi:hypothetical protein
MGDDLNELLKCNFCDQLLNNAMLMPCHHVACDHCLRSNIKSNKITCLSCDKVYSVDSKNGPTPSNLIAFIEKMKSNTYKVVEATPQDEAEDIDGICSSCSEQNQQQQQQKNKEIPNETMKKLSLCNHCQKNLCENCRIKHYNDQRVSVILKATLNLYFYLI